MHCTSLVKAVTNQMVEGEKKETQPLDGRDAKEFSVILNPPQDQIGLV